jgi:hypothetical protein
MFDLNGQRVARSERDLKLIPEEPGNATVVTSWGSLDRPNVWSGKP